LGAAQHGDLVPQHQQFRVLDAEERPSRTKPAAEPDEDQVEQAKGHGRPSCPTADLGASPQLTGTADFWHPTPDPLHLAAVFGISYQTAIRYAQAARQLLTD
jgi:hypothetical protein